MAVEEFLSLIRIYVMIFGNTFGAHNAFMEQIISPKLHKVDSVGKSDAIFAFVSVVSRVGTDLSSAMKKIPSDKEVVLVVLHPTFDRDYVAPDSRLLVKQSRVFPVDCLFNEDEGLFNCPLNSDAIRAVENHLRIDVPEMSTCIMKKPRNRKWVISAVVVSCLLILIIVLAFTLG